MIINCEFFRVNADLKETEAEVVIIQGMGYKAPSGKV